MSWKGSQDVRFFVALVLALAVCPAQAWGAAAVGSVRARVETRPVPHAGDAADDVAIWVNRRWPGRSAIIGTDKKGGIAVYGLDGHLVQYRADGEMNNVDLRRNFPLGARRVTLVAASNRSNDSIAIYRLVPRTRKLVDVSARAIRVGMDAYGLCMYRSPRTSRYYVFVTSHAGEVRQWLLFRRSREVDARLVRRVQVGSQSEGCVADDRLGRLYVAEENVGIWRYAAEPGGGQTRTQVDSTGGRGHLAADVEGLAIARGRGRGGFLAASSQGKGTFVLYRRDGNAYVKTFKIVAGRIDAVSDTDGIEVATSGLGRLFPRGVFVAQDGANQPANHQNFKLVPWPAIARS